MLSRTAKLPLPVVNWTLGTVLVSVWLATFFFQFGQPRFGVDATSYYLLSKTFSGNFYQAAFIRQYVVAGEYGCSFPPLWPALIWLTDRVSGLGIYSGYVLGFLFGGLTLWPLLKSAREVVAEPAFAVFAALWGWACLLLMGRFLLAMSGGDTWPLAAFLMWSMVYVFVKRGEFGWSRAVALGLLAGLACLARFDSNLMALGVTAAVWWRAERRRWVVAAAYAATVAVVVSPWVIYSLSHFDRLYVADNTVVAAAAPQLDIRDYLPEPVPTLREDFSGWLGRVGRASLKLMEVAALMTVINLPVGLALVAGPGLWLWHRLQRRPVCSGAECRPLRSLAVILLFRCLTMVGLALTGYGRIAAYHMLPVSSLGFWAICASRPVFARGVPWPWALAMVGVIVGVAAQRMHQLEFSVPTLQRTQNFLQGRQLNRAEDQLPMANRLQPGDRVLCLNGYDAYFCYISGAMVFTAPTNWERLSIAERRQFLRERAITVIVFLAGDDPARREGLELVPDPVDNRVWRLDAPSRPQTEAHQP